jgi:hypothetical protein
MATRCPICGATVPRDPRPASFPFCTVRCRLVDLGNWLDGVYRAPAPEEAVFTSQADEGDEAPS